MVLWIECWRTRKKLHKAVTILTRITNQKTPYAYIHVYQIIKNQGPCPYNSLRHADNRKYFSGLSLTQNRRDVLMFYLAREVVRICRCSCWKKGNFIMVHEFKPKKIDDLHLVYHFIVPLSILWFGLLRNSIVIYC